MVRRLHQPIQETNVTIQNASFGVKKGQNWKYPWGVIQRYPTTLINGTHYYDPKEPTQMPRRKQESNFFITINTNRAPHHHPGQSNEAYKAMEHALDVLKTDKAICACLTFGPKHPEHYAKDKFADVIENVQWSAGVETGEVLQRLHAHIWVTIKHYSQIQINRKMMGAIFRDAYNSKAPRDLRVNGTPYVSVKLLPQSDFAIIMKQYMQKAMQKA